MELHCVSWRSAGTESPRRFVAEGAERRRDAQGFLDMTVACRR